MSKQIRYILGRISEIGIFEETGKYKRGRDALRPVESKYMRILAYHELLVVWLGKFLTDSNISVQNESADHERLRVQWSLNICINLIEQVATERQIDC